jgi:hypothetical protein
MFMLCFPEIAMLFTNLPAILSIQDYLYVVAFGFGLIVMAYGALYVRDSTFDDFTKWIFFVGIGWTLLILFGVPLLIGAVIQAIIGVALLIRNYYRFEIKS